MSFKWSHTGMYDAANLRVLLHVFSVFSQKNFVFLCVCVCLCTRLHKWWTVHGWTLHTVSQFTCLYHNSPYLLCTSFHRTILQTILTSHILCSLHFIIQSWIFSKNYIFFETVEWLGHIYIYTYLLTFSMVQSPSWEANWFAASKEIPRISRNPKVHYCIHKLPPPVPIPG